MPRTWSPRLTRAGGCEGEYQGARVTYICDYSQHQDSAWSDPSGPAVTDMCDVLMRCD